MNAIDYNNFINITHDALSFIGYIVDTYGSVLVPHSGKKIEDLLPEYHHDYFYFCLAKATRSLLAANELAKMRFREDVMTLARSAYETYLLLSNALENEKFIDKSVIISLKLKYGIADFYKNCTGKIDFQKVIVSGEKNPIEYDMRVSTLSKNTVSKLDKRIHKELYKYISEFSHSDFIGSGNYRTDNNKNYNVEPQCLHLETIFIITYISYLLMQSLDIEYSRYKNYPFNQLENIEKEEITRIIVKLREHLFVILSNLDMSMIEVRLKELLIERLNENIS